MNPYPPAWLPLRPSLWLAARLLPVLAAKRELGPLLAASTPPDGSMPYRGAAAADIVGHVTALTARPWRMRGRRCLREGLLAFRYLRLAGFPAVLRFGVDRTSLGETRMKAHCWVTVGDEVVLNPPQPGMVEIMAHDGGAPAARIASLSA